MFIHNLLSCDLTIYGAPLNSDIDNNVNSIQPVGGAKPEEGVAREEVDHPPVEVDSEGEYFQDSIDDLSCNSDETHSLKSSNL